MKCSQYNSHVENFYIDYLCYIHILSEPCQAKTYLRVCEVICEQCGPRPTCASAQTDNDTPCIKMHFPDHNYRHGFAKHHVKTFARKSQKYMFLLEMILFKFQSKRNYSALNLRFRKIKHFSIRFKHCLSTLFSS